ncbi:MAG: hypothetical protein Q8P93_00200 [bacterium]|nr:hypothetical protein [bacterium]
MINLRREALRYIERRLDEGDWGLYTLTQVRKACDEGLSCLPKSELKRLRAYKLTVDGKGQLCDELKELIKEEIQYITT